MEPPQSQVAPQPASKPSFFNKLKHPSQFSKPQLGIFVLAFAVIGYFLVKAFAAAPLLTSLQAESMTPSGGTSPNSGFMTNLANNGSVTTPFLWTFMPGADASAGYFFADGKQLAKINGPGPYVLRLNSGMLSSGAHKLGGSWDTTTGVHQTFPSAYAETVNNVAGSSFVTTLNNNMTVNAPYVWAFDPGTATSAGYFFADGKQLSKISGPGPYVLLLGGSDNNVLTAGAHQLGHSWDTTAGVHQTPPSAYAVTYNPGTNSAVNSSIISDSTASGGKAVKFGPGVTLTGSLSLPSQAASLTVMAHGEQCSSAWPQMTVKVDGQSVVSTTVSSTAWTAYNLNLTLNSGSHSLAITNSGSGCANLYADVTNLYGPNVTTNPPTVSLSASPSSISSGQSSTLSWNSTNATSCNASGAWSGAKPTSGSASTGAISLNSTYTLTCTGSGGSAIASTTVTVSTSTATSYDTAIAYAQNRPAFTPTRTVNVSSASQLLSAVSNLQAGDLVKATAPFTVSSGSGTPLVISKRLSAPAVIDLTAGVKIVYTGTSSFNGVWMRNSQNIRLYGGDVSTSDTGNSCVVWYASQHVTWWGLKVHDCGGAGFGIANAKPPYSFAGPVEYDDIQAEVWKIGQHPAWDDHAELCTGIHGANLSDDNTYAFDNNRFAFYVHDTNCIGGGIEFGTSNASPLPTNNIIYLKCVNFTFISTIQTGGNCFQSWGYGVLNTDIKYLEANSITGHPYLASGLYHKPNNYLSTDVLEYGRATNVRLNPRYATDKNWDTIGGTIFKDTSPKP